MTDARLTGSEREALLALARAAIRDRLLADGSLARARDGLAITPGLAAARGVFVTIKSPRAEEACGEPRLRGCIGTLRADEPLNEAVARCAVEAAFADPRFPPLARDELPEITVSVSALGAPRPVDSADAIVPGVHGVILEHGAHRAVFLPQVATEQGWDVPTLLENLARKAGLRREAWKEGRLFVFEAEVFGDP